MQAVKGTDTSLEKVMAEAFRRQGWRFQRNYTFLPGKPDFVFARARLVVFVDGDFWHGWRFPLWEAKLSEYWRKKIARTRRRDRNNFRWLRRHGWNVLRIWGHEVERDLEGAVERVKAAIASARVARSNAKSHGSQQARA